MEPAEAPTIRRSQACKQLRQSVSISPSQFAITERPPSTISVAPVMNEASSLASQMIGQAISSGGRHCAGGPDTANNMKSTGELTSATPCGAIGRANAKP